MSLGRIFSTRAVDTASSKISAPAESSFAPADEGFEESKSKTDPRSAVQRRFMSMMEAHDRMRARVLGTSSTSRYMVSGD
jgi:hypothetical protein